MSEQLKAAEKLKDGLFKDSPGLPTDSVMQRIRGKMYDFDTPSLGKQAKAAETIKNH